MKRTIILLMALTSALGTATLAAALKISSATEKVIRLKAKNFEFTPGEITVSKGEPVILELTSEDRAHGFNLPDFHVRTEVKPGVVSRVHFTPDKTGKFSFTCDVFCGSGHEDMSGVLVVTE
ncbi:MAG: cupredoxin domain-containing protein [Blastocatellales bacterium]